MRTRAPALAAVVAFALAVALVAGLAGRGDDQDLVKLPVASLGGAGAAEAAAATSERSALLAPAFGPVEYRAAGALPALAATAPAYRLGSGASAAAIGRLAGALGLDGAVEEEGDGWVVRDGDRELRVQRFPGLPWYLGSACPEVPVTSDDGGDTAVSCRSAAGSSASGGGSTSSEAVAARDACAPSAAASAADLPAPVPLPPGTAIPFDCDAPGAACSRPAPAPAPPPCPEPCDAGCSTPAAGPAVAEPAPVPVPGGAPCPPDAPADCVSAGPATTVVVAPCAKGAVECVPPLTGVAPAPFPTPSPPPRPADLPSRQEAERLAREAFARLGAGLDGFAMDDGWSTWEARVEASVDGLPVVGLGHGLGIGAGGRIVHGSGFLARPDRIGDYPLVGTEAGLRRLQDEAGLGPRPLIAVDDGPATTFPPGAEPALDLPALDLPALDVDPCPPGETDCPAPPALPAPVVQTVTGARLALVAVDALLVPAYVFELEGGGETPPVPAVTDEWLDRAAPPRLR